MVIAPPASTNLVYGLIGATVSRPARRILIVSRFLHTTKVAN